MNKLLFTLIALLPIAANATDGGFYFKPYVGANYDQYHVNYSSGNDGIFSDNLNGGDIHIGARVHKYLSFEGGYFDTAYSDKSGVLGTNINTSAKLDGWNADILGYLPLDDAQRFELIGTVGVARTKAKGTASAVSSITLSDTETKGRIGAGGQFWITDKLNVRALVRYQDADFKNTIDNVVVTSIGLNWQF